jgi:hypothetical protein
MRRADSAPAYWPGATGPGMRTIADVSAQPGEWGRVADDGTVYVRVGETEHAVGQYPEGTPEEALAFFTRRYDGVAFEVKLLEQRVLKGAMTPDEARSSIEQLETTLATPNAVGDIIALTARLEALRPVLARQRDERREQRAKEIADARARKEQIVEAAEKLSTSKDWRNGANRLRELLDEWKALPRLSKSADDELWHRFSGARTGYTKARKAHFAEQDERRGSARVVKERLVKEAEALAESTDWGGTSTAYRDLMRDWKAAGPAPRGVDDQLWGRFRAAQDTFFAAREAANAEQDKEFAANAEVKRALLVEAESLLPVRDLDAAKRAFRTLAEKWDAAGKVPRADMTELEARMRKVEQAIRGLEDDQWRRTDPEKSARADDVVSKLRDAIAKIETQLEAARSAGDQKKIATLESDLAGRQMFLEAAQRAAADFA